MPCNGCRTEIFNFHFVLASNHILEIMEIIFDENSEKYIQQMRHSHHIFITEQIDKKNRKEILDQKILWTSATHGRGGL